MKRSFFTIKLFAQDDWHKAVLISDGDSFDNALYGFYHLLEGGHETVAVGPVHGVESGVIQLGSYSLYDAELRELVPDIVDAGSTVMIAFVRTGLPTSFGAATNSMVSGPSRGGAPIRLTVTFAVSPRSSFRKVASFSPKSRRLSLNPA